MNGKKLKVTETEMDVGVFMSISLRQSVHITEAVSRANSFRSATEGAN